MGFLKLGCCLGTYSKLPQYGYIVNNTVSVFYIDLFCRLGGSFERGLGLLQRCLGLMQGRFRVGMIIRTIWLCL